MPADYYTTNAGDTWDLIAWNVYGVEDYLGQLLLANPAYADVQRFDAGVEILCPDFAIAVSNNLPPWKS